MKSKDVAIIIVVAFFSAIFAFIISNMLLASPNNLQTEVEVVEPISAEFRKADDRYFNEAAINPTQQIRIKENQNQDPFNGQIQ